MNHFDEMTALLLLEGQLDAERARHLRAHASSCGECRGLLLALEKEGVWLRQVLSEDEESVPARLMEAPARGAVPWGWIATLGFGAGGAYTLWSSIIEPWRAQAAQAGFTQGNVLTMLFFSGAFWKGWDAMRSLTEFLAVATLGTVVLWLLRRRARRVATFAVIMPAALCALALPPSAAAADIEHGNPNYTLAAGEEIKSDLVVAGTSIRIEGDVDGDLIAWAENVVVDGRVHGDILCFAQQLRVNGSADGNVRAWVQTLTLTGTVARNVMTGAGHVDLEDRGKIGGSLTMGVGEAQLNGAVERDLLASVGDFELNGSVGGNATIHGGDLKIGPHAEIKGTTKYEGRREAEVSSGAKLGSPLQFSRIKHGPDYTQPRFYWHQILFFGASFLFGLGLLLIAPRLFFDAASACKRTGPALGFGFLFLIATPIAAILVCLTIVGLGVGIATLLLFPILLYSSPIFVGSWLGEKLLGASQGTGSAIGRLALGLAIIRGLKMIPYIGWFVAAVVLIWGLGAMALALYRRLRPEQGAPAPSPAAA